MTAEVELDVDKDESQKPNISAYLQAPRKKRRNFVVIAASESVDKTIMSQVEGFVRKTYPQLGVSYPKNVKELARQFNRSISLLIVDDQFSGLEDMMNAINVLKTKTKRDIAPVLFFTKTPQSLVEAYQKKLSQYQECDEYCDLGKLNLQQILGRVRAGIDNKNRRKSRRYKVNIDCKFFHLVKDKDFNAKLVDLSLHGAFIQSKDVGQFTVGDQIKLTIPVARFFSGLAQGEFLKLSAKVRRVSLGGDIAGISFEHVIDSQRDRLTSFLTRYAREQLIK